VRASIPKMGKRYQITHFLDLRGIRLENPQHNDLMPDEIKKSVSLVSPVSTVSFCCAYNSCPGEFVAQTPILGLRLVFEGLEGHALAALGALGFQPDEPQTQERGLRYRSALDEAAVGRGGNKPGMCREMNR
jgi:hypothetical protein